VTLGLLVVIVLLALAAGLFVFGTTLVVTGDCRGSLIAAVASAGCWLTIILLVALVL
jgi:hypothetical protein